MEITLIIVWQFLNERPGLHLLKILNVISTEHFKPVPRPLAASAPATTEVFLNNTDVNRGVSLQWRNTSMNTSLSTA